MNILYKTVYSNSVVNFCELVVIDDGYQSDGYHLTVNDGYIVYSKIRYNIAQTEIVIPIPIPDVIYGFFCLDIHSSNNPVILIDEVFYPTSPYGFNDGNYKFIDVFFQATANDIKNGTIKFLHISPKGAS